MPLAPAYVSSVLSENFEDAKRLFLARLLSIPYAHLVMLAECGILPAGDAHALPPAPDAVSTRDLGAAAFDSAFEDLFDVDRLVAESCSETIARRLHTARSRNDIDMPMHRMRQRERVPGLLDAAADRRLLERSATL